MEMDAGFQAMVEEVECKKERNKKLQELEKENGEDESEAYEERLE